MQQQATRNEVVVIDLQMPFFLQAMGFIGLLALAANGSCLALLWKHRHEDVNMSSVWECSRNDIASNIAVIVAGALVWAFNSGWPDVVVGALLAALFLRSAIRVFRGSLAAIRLGPQRTV
jgi:Co/Zn/Cd efflux system component